MRLYMLRGLPFLLSQQTNKRVTLVQRNTLLVGSKGVFRYYDVPITSPLDEICFT